MRLWRLLICLLVLGLFSVSLKASEPGLTNAPAIELTDQYDAPQKLSFPCPKVTLLAIADRSGSEEVSSWIAALKPSFAGRIDIRGLAQVGGIPKFWRSRLRHKFQETHSYPVMMDWTGRVCEQFGAQPGVANVLVIDRTGIIRARFCGKATESAVSAARQALEKAISADRDP